MNKRINFFIVIKKKNLKKKLKILLDNLMIFLKVFQKMYYVKSIWIF